MAVASGPTENQLLQMVPESNAPGSFPPQLLHPGERIVFETRPNLLRGYGGRIILLALIAAFFAWVFTGAHTWWDPFAWIFTGLPVLGILLIVWGWRNTAYALTDQRVLSISGLRRSDFNAATVDRVVNVQSVRPGSGSLEFTLAPFAMGAASQPRLASAPGSPAIMWGASLGTATPRAELRAGRIVWRNLAQPAVVFSFLDQAIPLYARRLWESGRRQWLTSQLAAEEIRCSYCGNTVDLMAINLDAPTCPRCSAPLPIRVSR